MDAGGRGIEAGLGGRVQRVFISADCFTGITASGDGFACGYADQAHFTREFGSCIGLPPGHFRAGLAPAG